MVNMSSAAHLVRYYAERAHEYEKIYSIPERQQDISRLKERVRGLLAGQSVLELACGTGYWTQVIAQTAKSITATDINEEVLEIARSKQLSEEGVRFIKDDSFKLESIQRRFTAGFASFWWSHIRRSQLSDFLDVFHAKLRPGAVVVFTDNIYVEGKYYPITRADGEGNTYQERRLESGKTYEILKNFPDESEFKQLLNKRAINLRYERLTFYWCLSYNVNGA
jgi:2-polyprenyl-3-methyl-5-hydroxy-6-metoxy-1,4-benzoquinol methylase